MVVELGASGNGLAPAPLRDAVRQAMKATGIEIAAVLTVGSLPVDIRHNSKIDRVRVGQWAQRVLDGGRVGAP
jgi:hypothetical protein